MPPTKPFDFSGYVTKYGVKCSDGRTISKGAFESCNGKIIPMVWQHVHNEPGNVLGHGLLEDRTDGMYVYGFFNETPAGGNAKSLVVHGDITSLSIYANQLVEKSKLVIHGMIREFSLVLSGANPGAVIDNVVISHGDGSEDTSLEDEAVIYNDSTIDLPKPKEETEIQHADNSSEEDKTVGEIFDTLSEVQKNAVYAIIAAAVEIPDNSAAQSSEEGEETTMKHNVFDGSGENNPRATLTHDQFAVIMKDAQSMKSLKASFLAHAVEYGIENIDYLFPDARTVTSEPTMITRDMAWVSTVMNAIKKSPFSRIKTVHADITMDEARALGYVKGALKKEEYFSLMRRTTTPTTIYKKAKLDRDDIVDIVDLDVVAWQKAEMYIMIKEELARAVLISDGREAEDADKIPEANVRPIYKEAALYAPRVTPYAADADILTIIDGFVRARNLYKGSGSPTLYCTTELLTDMLLVRDTTDHRLYPTQAELEAAIRVSGIVEVPLMSGVSREDDESGDTLNLLGIMVNLRDYTLGADRGGELSFFEDFDIDYNQEKYLLETRVSGALTLPASALIFEQIAEEA